ncbi:MAG: 50S ribosomal protein P1 [Candidatus Micrarchaeaceae archaeon]
MEYVYAALLLDAVGKEINEENVKAVIKAAGATPDDAQAKAVVASLKGVNIKEIINNAAAQQVQQPASKAAEKAEAPKKEDKKEEKKSEEEAVGGLAGLFG